MIRSTLLAVAFALLAAVSTAETQSAGFTVVANPSVAVTAMETKDVARLFLKQRTRWPDGGRAVPVDQKMTAAVRVQFSEAVLGKSIADVESYWNGQVFAGKDSPPTTLASDDEVLAFVRRTPGAVGYVSAAAATSGVTVIVIQ